MTEPARETVRWTVRGRVQGVGFRWFVQRKAEDLAIAGWARNLPDGRVEVVAAGSKHSIAELETALGTGPRFARVDNVERSDIPDEGALYKRFEIK